MIDVWTRWWYETQFLPPKLPFTRLGDIATRVQSNEIKAIAPGHWFNIMGTSPTSQPQQYQTKLLVQSTGITPKKLKCVQQAYKFPLYRGRILERNSDKSLKSFPPYDSQSTLLTEFALILPLPWAKIGLKLVCNENIAYGNLKSENSQDYDQQPRRNCTFMISASGVTRRPTRVLWQYYLQPCLYVLTQKMLI